MHNGKRKGGPPDMMIICFVEVWKPASTVAEKVKCENESLR
jgi:hypothetical protein